MQDRRQGYAEQAAERAQGAAGAGGGGEYRESGGVVQQGLADLMVEAGWARPEWRNLTGGIVALHRATAN